jgi:hypothetical protein
MRVGVPGSARARSEVREGAANVELPAGAAAASMSPVSQSAGPCWVSILLRMIWMEGFLSRGSQAV